MPQTGAAIGQGAIFSIGNATGGASTAYVDVSIEITNMTSPQLNRDAIDATHLLSPENFREYIAGLKGQDTFTLEFNYLPAVTDELYANWQAGAGDYQMTYPDGIRMQFSGIPTAWKPGDASAETMKGTMTIQPSGKPTMLAAI